MKEHVEKHKEVLTFYLKEGLVLDDDELRLRLVLTVNHVHVETPLLQHINIYVTPADQLNDLTDQ